jgi:hypothetical protein
VAGLVQTGVRFIVIGGVAATAHGSRRVTNDLDICYDPTLDNRVRLAGLLAGWHAYPRGGEPGLPFVMDAVTLQRSPILTLTTDEGDLDCLDEVKGVGPYRAVADASEAVTVADVTFPVLGLPALIKAKRATRRPKDREALLELEALMELKRTRRH